MRLLAVLVLVTLTGCKKSEPVAETIEKTAPQALQKYGLKGEVTRLDPENKIATIKHEAIGDWMGPMTMDFPVKDPADFAKLAPGQPVEGSVFVQGLDYWVGEVKSPPGAK